MIPQFNTYETIETRARTMPEMEVCYSGKQKIRMVSGTNFVVIYDKKGKNAQVERSYSS